MLFWGFLIYLFLIFVRPQDFVPAVRGLPLVNMVLVPLIVCSLFQVLRGKRIDFKGVPQNNLMIAFWIVIVLSTLSVRWLQYTLTTFIDWGKVVLTYFLIVLIIDSQKKLKISVWAIVLCTTVTAILGVLQAHGRDVTGVGLLHDGRITGVGIFGTNQLALTLVFILPFVFGLFCLTKSSFARILLCGIWGVYWYAIYLTGSRAGMLFGASVPLLITVVFTRRNIVRIIGIIFTVLSLVVFSYFSSRMDTIGSYQEDSSAMGRIDVWGAGLSALKSTPFLGIGMGQFNTDYFERAPHSSYVEAVVELGLVGFFIWLGLFYFSLKRLRLIDIHKGGVVDDQARIISKSLQVSLYAYLLGSLTSGNTYYPTLYILFALVVAMQKLTGMDFFKKQPLFAFRDLRNIAVIEFSVILLIHILVRYSY